MFAKTLMLCSLTIALGVASSERAFANSREQARAAFMQGRAAFKAGQFEAAAKYLSEAYRLKPHPALLRYLGQTYVKLGQAAKAIESFERYLKDAPQAPDREKVSRRIARLKKALAEAKAKASETQRQEAAAAAAAGKPAPTPAPASADTPLKVNLAPTGEDEEMPDVMGKGKQVSSSSRVDEPAGTRQPSRWKSYGKWTSAALGLGGLAAGVVFNILASSKASELEDAAKSGNPDLNQPTVAYNADHFALQQDYKRFNTMAVVSYIVGGVFSAAAVTLFILDRRSGADEQPRRTAIAPWLGKEGGGVAASVAF